MAVCAYQPFLVSQVQDPIIEDLFRLALKHHWPHHAGPHVVIETTSRSSKRVSMSLKSRSTLEEATSILPYPRGSNGENKSSTFERECRGKIIHSLVGVIPCMK